MDDFVAFILTHGRANKVITYKTLRRQGYTGRIVLVCDDEDNQLMQYFENFGRENVKVFSKAKIAETFDEINKGDRRTIVYARNVCFDLAKELGCKYFIELDDDYEYFSINFNGDYEWVNRVENCHNLDAVFSHILEFYKSVPQIKTIALAQGGDFIGGANGTFGKKVTLKRKAMNSFICSTDRPFKFIGRINEDVNTYTTLGSRGVLFLTLNQFSLEQKETQSNSGGMTDVYKEKGTYYKSFFTIITMPSCTKIGMIGNHRETKRLHHNVTWKNCVPQILRESIKKQ